MTVVTVTVNVIIPNKIPYFCAVGRLSRPTAARMLSKSRIFLRKDSASKSLSRSDTSALSVFILEFQ